MQEVRNGLLWPVLQLPAGPAAPVYCCLRNTPVVEQVGFVTHCREVGWWGCFREGVSKDLEGRGLCEVILKRV